MEEENISKAQPVLKHVTCIWDNWLEDIRVEERGIFIILQAVAASLAIACTAYLMWCHEHFKIKKLILDGSYKFFRIFLIAMHLRAFVPKSCRTLMEYYGKPEYLNCQACGVIDAFFSVFQMEILTHLCIDRYVVAKYLTKGWPIKENHHKMYLIISLFFSFLYSIPPLFGLGKYGLDFDCEACTFAMILPNDWTRFIIFFIWFLRSVKPVSFMLVMLYWARHLESRFTEEMIKKNDPYFTRIVRMIMSIFLLSWAPIAVIRGETLLYQFFYKKMGIISFRLVGFASVIYEITPVVVTIGIIYADKTMPVENPCDEKED